MMGRGFETLRVAARSHPDRKAVTENLSPPSPSSKPVFFLIVIAVVLAIVVAAFWFTIVNIVIPFISAVTDAYF